MEASLSRLELGSITHSVEEPLQMNLVGLQLKNLVAQRKRGSGELGGQRINVDYLISRIASTLVSMHEGTGEEDSLRGWMTRCFWPLRTSNAPDAEKIVSAVPLFFKMPCLSLSC